ncbi:MAG: primase large subunit [Thermoplasmata archaeon]|nr:primase large subunit [Thermoplasmata archaeon]
MSPRVHLAALARYPFLPEAAQAAAAEGPSLEELIGDRVWAGARRQGIERLRQAIDQGELPPAALGEASGRRELLEDLLAYVYARILVCALDDAYVVRRHALAEAVRVKSFLEGEADLDLVARAAVTLGLGFEPEPDGRHLRAHFTDYLRYAVHLKDMEWKLVTQPLEHGWVRLDARKTSRLVQEALRRKIESELPREISDEVRKAVEPDAAPLRETARVRKEAMSPTQFGKVRLDAMPPCMGHLLAELQQGVNVAHNGRFAITTFLHKIGLGSEDIMRLFAQAPDFREDLTRYQVEHITGVTSSTVYSVPGCDNLQTFNMCYADDLCRSKTKAGVARVKYPGDYYRYVSEAADVVDALAAKARVADPKALTGALAMSYGPMARLREITGSPEFAAMDPAALAAWIDRTPGVPASVVEGAPLLLVDGKDTWAPVKVLEAFLGRNVGRQNPAPQT